MRPGDLILASGLFGTVASILFFTLPEQLHAWKASKATEQIIAAYQTAAIEGKVLPIADGSNTTSSHTMCFCSLPSSIEVLTDAGDRLRYAYREGNTNSLGCHLVFRGGVDAKGLELTNAPVPHFAIAVYTHGNIQNTRWHQLKPPFNIEHALREAGGLTGTAKERNTRIYVTRKDGKPMSVLKRDYATFILKQEDSIFVPARE